MTIQSREYNGVAIDYSNDMYSIEFVNNNGVDLYPAVGFYVSNGLY